MPESDPLKIIPFATAKDLNLWLSLNHTSENELWVKIYKKNTGIESVSWSDVVIEVLCWGWIDGIKKSIDDQADIDQSLR